LARGNRSRTENTFLDKRRGLLTQDKQQKMQEYFVYFKFYVEQYWGSRAAVGQKVIFSD